MSARTVVTRACRRARRKAGVTHPEVPDSWRERLGAYYMPLIVPAAEILAKRSSTSPAVPGKRRGPVTVRLARWMSGGNPRSEGTPRGETPTDR